MLSKVTSHTDKSAVIVGKKALEVYHGATERMLEFRRANPGKVKSHIKIVGTGTTIARSILVACGDHLDTGKGIVLGESGISFTSETKEVTRNGNTFERQLNSVVLTTKMTPTDAEQAGGEDVYDELLSELEVEQRNDKTNHFMVFGSIMAKTSGAKIPMEFTIGATGYSVAYLAWVKEALEAARPDMTSSVKIGLVRSDEPSADKMARMVVTVQIPPRAPAVTSEEGEQAASDEEQQAAPAEADVAAEPESIPEAAQDNPADAAEGEGQEIAPIPAQS